MTSVNKVTCAIQQQKTHKSKQTFSSGRRWLFGICYL